MSLPRKKPWDRTPSVKRYQEKRRAEALESGTYSSLQASQEKAFARREKPMNRHAANASKRKRSELARQSAAKRREQAERRRVLREMTGGVPVVCQRCHRAEATDAHELLPRSAGGSPTDPANIRLICRSCHDHIHAHPAESYRAGWLIRSTDA